MKSSAPLWTILLTHLLETLPVDPERIYVTGNSMGGYGTYAWAGASPKHFAAIAPMVGGLGANSVRHALCLGSF